MTSVRIVSVANRHPRLRIDRRSLTRAIGALDADFKILPADRAHLTGRRKSLSGESAIGPGELSLVFLSDKSLAELHGRFLDDPANTDVITFEAQATLGSAGEICMSVDTATAYAKKHRRDFSAELMLYVVHGWLHLAGYDDLKPARKRVMRRAEARAMRLLGKVQPAKPAFGLKPKRVKRRP
ncbi:MAG: hypothetical protein JWM32_730 [Verrucomicrobia bacterium]|nr:hypothetical protein [Verrucomicrobiota bacterium]